MHFLGKKPGFIQLYRCRCFKQITRVCFHSVDFICIYTSLLTSKPPMLWTFWPAWCFPCFSRWWPHTKPEYESYRHRSSCRVSVGNAGQGQCVSTLFFHCHPLRIHFRHFLPYHLPVNFFFFEMEVKFTWPKINHLKIDTSGVDLVHSQCCATTTFV